MPKKKILIITGTLVLIVVVISLLVGGKKTQKQINEAEQMRLDSISLKVGVMPTLGCLPFYFAERNGIYDSLGLDIKLINYQAQMDIDTALQNGRVECAYTDLIRAARMQDRGAQISFFAGIEEKMQLLTQNKLRIRKAEQLKERLVAIARLSVTDYLTDIIIDSAKIDDGDVYRPQVNDISLRAEMMFNEHIDAAFMPEPYASLSAARGHRVIFTPIQNLTGMAVTTSALQDSTRVREIELLIEGYNLAVKRLNNSKELSKLNDVANFYRLNPVDEHLSDSIVLPTYSLMYFPTQHAVSEAIEFLKKREQLSSRYQRNGLLTNKFMKP